MLESLARDHLAVSGHDAASPFHTSQVSLSFGEAIDFAVLRSAWEAVSKACPALRSSFDEPGALTTGDAPSFAWTELDWQQSLPADPGAEWNRLVEADVAQPIAAAGQPACRFTAIRLPNGQGHALWSFHAALLDEVAASNVLHAWLAIYDALRTGGDVPEISDPPQASADSADDSWKIAFEGMVPVAPLIVFPLPDSNAESTLRKSISHTFERSERAEFAALAESHSASLESLFGAAWAFLVSRTTSGADTLLLEPASDGSGFSRRESLVARRHRIDSHRQVSDLVREFEKESSGTRPPADLRELAATLEWPVPPSPTAFVSTRYTLNDRLQLAMPRWMAADVKLLWKSPAPITLRFVATDRPEVSLDYDPAALSDEAARALFDLYRKTLVEFAENFELAGHALSAPAGVLEGPELPPTFRSLVPQCLQEHFADIAGETPDASAVEIDGTSVTFSELNQRANQFARYLRKRGAEPGDRVALAMSKSADWIAAMIGILRAGAVLVPVDASAPEVPTGSKLLVVDKRAEEAPEDSRIIDLSKEASALQSEKNRGIQIESDPAKIAVELPDAQFTHEQLVSAFQSTAAMLGLAGQQRVVQFSPSETFSAIEEAFATLLSGSTLLMRADDRWATRTAFQEFIEQNGVTTLSIPIPFFSQWIHYLSELSLQVPACLAIVSVRGADIAPSVLEAWRNLASPATLQLRRECPAAAGLSLIATSETTLGGIGHPAPGARARIVDARGLPAPAGFSGSVEISVGDGGFVPMGFEAFLSPTDGLFLRESLISALPGAASRLRHAAVSHPGIFDAHVEERTVDGRDQWCLWIVPRISDSGEPHDFREHLGEASASPPRRIRALPRLPLDSKGFVDSRALDELIPDDVAAPPAQRPGSPEEERLRQAVARALGGRRISLDETIRDGSNRPDVSARLHEAAARVEPRVIAGDFEKGFSIRSLARAVRGREVASDVAWTPIVPLRAAGKRPPIVFVHDYEGSSKIFEPLAAQLGDDQPCYALTARGLADPGTCHSSIPEMAESYIEALQRFESAGGYRLVGFGFGGLVAYEIAARLQSAGIDVPLLALLATAPSSARSGLSGWKQSLQGLFGRKRAPEPSARQRRLQESPVYQANQRAAAVYAPPILDTEVHVFVPDHDFPPFSSVETGWRRSCDNARFYQVPCGPDEMLEEPAAEAIAGALSSLVTSGDVDVEE